MTVVKISGGDPVLEVSGLSAGYRGLPVVHGVDINVAPGEVVALLGPNGAGKSTTLMTIAGHLPPIAGSIKLDGKGLRGPSYKRARVGLAFVSEERSLFHKLTTEENLRLGRGGTEAALEFIPELRPLLARRAGLLSGGEQQYVAMARALAMRPRLLLIDELSLGLAPLIVTRLHRAVRDIADSGIGVLIVEQYARRALAIADQVYVMRRGRIELSGPSADIQDRLAEVEGIYLSVETRADHSPI